MGTSQRGWGWGESKGDNREEGLVLGLTQTPSTQLDAVNKTQAAVRDPYDIKITNQFPLSHAYTRDHTHAPNHTAQEPFPPTPILLNAPRKPGPPPGHTLAPLLASCLVAAVSAPH